MFSIFKRYKELILSLSAKKDGPMKYFDESARDKGVSKNREIFLNKLGVDAKKVVSAGLVHGNNIEIVGKENGGEKIVGTDGLLTGEKNLFLSITVADCLPIFIYDPENQVIGLIHGGWRSLARNILALTIKKLTDNFNSPPKNILVGIGPGLGACHFKVKDDVLKEFTPFRNSKFLTGFKSSPSIIIRKNKKIFLDLKKIAKIQLLNLGLKKENIEISPECTYCLSDKYFSYRREKPKEIKTMMAIIGRK